MHAIRTTLLGLAAAALATISVSAPAHAESRTDRDAQGDVKTLATGRASTSAVDITSVKASYANGTIGFKISVVSLAGRGYQAIGWVGTGEDRYFINYTPGSEFEVLVGSSGDPFDEVIDCSGATASANRTKDVVTLKLPASCIGSPTAIQTNAEMARFTDGGASELNDQGLTRKPHESGTAPKLGPTLTED